MKIFKFVFIFFLNVIIAQAQPLYFVRDQHVKFLSSNNKDTLLNAFAGGLNSPQISEIDLNNDGKQDLFVFDRSGSSVHTFIRQANGSFLFAPHYAAQFPRLNSWALLRDYDADGKPDIFSEVDLNAQPEKDKLIWTHGIRYLKNTSTGNKLSFFQSKNQLFDTGTSALPPSNIGIQNMDIPSIEDIDNDGDLDLLYFGYGKNTFSYAQNVSVEKGYKNDSLLFVFRDECWGYTSYLVNKNGFKLHDDAPCYSNYKGHGAHNGSAVCLIDVNGDGAKEVLYGDVGYNSIVLLSNGKFENSLGRDSIVAQDTAFPRETQAVSVETFPACYKIDVDADGKKDLLVAPNADIGGKTSNMIQYFKNNGAQNKDVYQFVNESFLCNTMLDLGSGAKPLFIDIDSDGDEDLLVCTQGEYTRTKNANDRLVLFLNKSSASQILFELADTNFLNINTNKGANSIYQMHPCFGDLNGDGKPDLLIGDLNGNFHYYQNNSSNGNWNSFEKISGAYFNMYGGTYITPQLVDMNNDGALDIIAGRKNGTLVYFQNKGTPSTPNFESKPTIDSIGNITSADFFDYGNTRYYFDGYAVPFVCDLDKDGKKELILSGNDGTVALYPNFDLMPGRVYNPIYDLYREASSAESLSIKFGKKSAACAVQLAQKKGLYLCIGNIKGGIELFQIQLNDTISGIGEISNEISNYKLFPNPVQHTLNLQSNSMIPIVKACLFDLQGKLLAVIETENNLTEIDLSAFKPGMYVLSLENKLKQVFHSKILKE